MNLQNQYNERMRETRMRERKVILYSRLAVGFGALAVILALVSLALAYVGV